ncbi:MAG: C25 family cysteine peptidase [Candidatus Eisenbacteria bacterium]
MNPISHSPPPAARALLAAGFALLSLAAPAHAAEIRLVSADASGVTLQLEVGNYVLEPDGDQGRFVPVVDGLARTDAPGRPRLPYAAALLALPPGTRALARVLSSGAEETRDAAPIAIAARPEFARDAVMGAMPVLTPQDAIRDGAWPLQVVTLGEMLTMRERTLVPVQVFPFRYDEAGARLTLTRSITVRVDFVGAGRAVPAGELDEAPDPQFDAVFSTQVLNWEQGKTWRARRPAARDGGLLRTRDRLGAAAQTPGGPVVNAFDEDEIEVRVRIDTTGVYGVEYDSLAVYGYPAGVPIGQVSVHRHEFAQDQSPPYTTIDLPAEVDDDGDGVFGPGDKVVVWVWDWAQRSRASRPQREWGDAEVIYVTRRAAAAQIAHRNGWLARADLTPLASYPTRQTYERNLTYFGFSPDTLLDVFSWTNFGLYCAPDAFPFETNDIDAGLGSSLTVRWLGINSTPHITWARVTNGSGQVSSVVDSAVWFGIRQDVRTGALAAGALTEGPTNTLRIWGKTFAADDCADNPIVGAGLNTFDVEYWRRFKPIRNYLPFNSGTQTSDFEVRAGPFINQGLLRVYDVTDSTRPFRLDNVNISTVGPDVFVRVQDTATPGVRRQYVAFDIPKSPAPGAMSAVTRRRVFDRVAGDYLLIVPEGFMAAVQPLVALHRSQGMSVVVAPLESIQDEFNGGRKSSYAIKRFVRYAYNNWNARFVLLAGDGSEDPRRYFPTSSPDIVPIAKLYGPVPVPVGSTDYLPELIPSDMWYVWCLNCPNPPAAQFKPDLYIGRLPVSTLAQVNAVVAKIVGYENLTGDVSWRQKMLLMADDAYSGVSTFGGPGGSTDYCRRPGELVFARINTVVDSLIRKSAGLAQTQVDLFNLSYYVPNRSGEFTTSGGPDTCRTNRTVFETRARATATPELFSRLNAGRMWWNYQGHANEYVMSHESFYVNQAPTDDKNRLTNDARPFFFTAFSCHPNSFGRIRGGNDATFGPAFGEELVVLPNRGAIASWASVGYEQLPADHTKHINVYLAHAMFVNPPRDEVLGDRGSRTVLGEVLLSALLANYAGRLSFVLERDVAVTYALLGDPATRLSIGAPQSIVTANTQPVTSGQDIRLTSSGTGLTLDATLVSTVRLDSLVFERRDALGTTVIWTSGSPLPAGLTLTPAFPDTARATTVYGGRRFRLTYADNLRPDSYRYVFRTFDRYGLESTFEAVFNFQVILRVGGQAISEGDFVSPTADLSLLVLSPKPLTPLTELTLTINGQAQVFTAAPANGDVSGREWILSWTHDPYAPGEVSVGLRATGGATVTRRFRVAETGLAVRLDNAMAFPNPFDEDYLRTLNPGSDIATVFSFDLVSATPADVTLRVYTISGRLIYQSTERRLDPRWHQIPWSGNDAEGFPIANGVYFYKLLANNGTGTAVHEGRLVKLRKPRRTASAENP